MHLFNEAAQPLERQEYISYYNDKAMLAFVNETSNLGWFLSDPKPRTIKNMFSRGE